MERPDIIIILADLTDISASHPQLVEELSQKWYTWASTHHVIPKGCTDLRMTGALNVLQ